MTDTDIVKDSLTFLGTGTSYGVPQIGCHCEVCSSDDPRNKRSRCSALMRIGGQNLLIDTTPDFRSQALREGVEDIDGVFITHVHADHVFGLDDLRPISLRRDRPIPVYTDADSAAQLRQIFDYVFRTEKRRLGIPWLVLREIEPLVPFQFGESMLLPIPVIHGRWPCLGLRYLDSAYITDAKRIPDESMKALVGVKTLCLDMLQEEPHATHMCKDESLAVVKALGDPQTLFIHMGHDIDHGPFNEALPQSCALAYDGLVIPLV